MPSKTPLMSLPSFKLAILVPVFFACFVWGAMYQSGLPDRCWSPECFNNAFELFKVPLAILALIFPAVALVASHHRSVQTAAQIERAESQIALTDAKNSFENYYKHQEYFFKFVKNIKEDKLYNFEFESVTKLYHSIFFNNSVVLFDPYENSINNLDRAYEIIVENDKHLPVEGDHHDKNEYAFTQLKIASFVLKISSVEIELNGKKTKINFMDDYKFFDKETILLIRNSIAEFINNLIFFSSNEKSVFCEMFTKGYLYPEKVES